jgi:hypothetical protein
LYLAASFHIPLNSIPSPLITPFESVQYDLLVKVKKVKLSLFLTN